MGMANRCSSQKNTLREGYVAKEMRIVTHYQLMRKDKRKKMAAEPNKKTAAIEPKNDIYYVLGKVNKIAEGGMR